MPTSIYHITKIENLARIVQAGRINAKNRLMRDGATHASIAFENIQDRRARTTVPCGPGGNLHDYVPFYFAPRSPMLYTINRGNVPGCLEGQKPVLHLVVDAEALAASKLPYVFTDGHAVMAFSNFYDDVKHLDQVDWDVMRSHYWNDTPEFPDRKRKRQAEFLVHDSLPWELVSGIGVKSNEIGDKVNAILRGADYLPRVGVEPSWYF